MGPAIQIIHQIPRNTVFLKKASKLQIILPWHQDNPVRVHYGISPKHNICHLEYHTSHSDLAHVCNGDSVRSPSILPSDRYWPVLIFRRSSKHKNERIYIMAWQWLQITRVFNPLYIVFGIYWLTWLTPLLGQWQVHYITPVFYVLVNLYITNIVFK